MTPTLRLVFAPAVILLVGLASPAPAWPLRPVGDQYVGARPTVRVDCNVNVRNQCYLQMNGCFQRHARDAAFGALRPCEAVYFACLRRGRCEGGRL